MSRIPHSPAKIIVYAMSMYSLSFIAFLVGALMVGAEWSGSIFDALGAIIILAGLVILSLASIRIRDCARNYGKFASIFSSEGFVEVMGKRFRIGEIVDVTSHGHRIRITLLDGKVYNFSSVLARGNHDEILVTIRHWVFS